MKKLYVSLALLSSLVCVSSAFAVSSATPESKCSNTQDYQVKSHGHGQYVIYANVNPGTSWSTNIINSNYKVVKFSSANVETENSTASASDMVGGQITCMRIVVKAIPGVHPSRIIQASEVLNTIPTEQITPLATTPQNANHPVYSGINTLNTELRSGPQGGIALDTSSKQKILPSAK